jgi:hypothetical protein
MYEEQLKLGHPDPRPTLVCLDETPWTGLVIACIEKRAWDEAANTSAMAIARPDPSI